MKEFEIGNEEEKRLIIEEIIGDEKLYKNPMDPRLEHMLIFLEQTENIYAICRNPEIKNIEDEYYEDFKGIEKFILDRKININIENTKILFLISFSTKNNISSSYHAQLLVGNEKTFVINDDQNKILFKLDECSLFDSNYENLYQKEKQGKLLEFTFPSKEIEECPYVISTPTNFTTNACAICVVAASRFFVKKYNEGKNLQESIMLISSNKNCIKELLTNIHNLRDIKEVTKGTSYDKAVLIDETNGNVDVNDEDFIYFGKNDQKSDLIDLHFYTSIKKVDKEIISNKNPQVIEQIQDTQEQARNWSDFLRENMIIKTQDNISIKKNKTKTKCNLI